MNTDLATAIARHRESTITNLAHTITTTPNTHAELLHHLDQIWQKDTDHTDANDRMWLDTTRHLTPELRTTLRHHALNAGQYYAARCLAYLTATA